MDRLVAEFPTVLAAFTKNPPFSLPGQYEYHRDTVARRRELATQTDAIRDPAFVALLYKTLRAWGIGSRGSRLVSPEDFAKALCRHQGTLASLTSKRIDADDLDVPGTSEELWSVIRELEVVDNDAKIVAGTKALHHLLPELVVPMDREYTGRFFGWRPPELQYEQKKCFSQAFTVFAQVARSAKPSQYVGSGWNTSQTKVIDNAVVGFLLAKRDALGGDLPRG